MWCETCQREILRAWDMHVRGIAHTQHDRLIALLRENCLTQTQIADRMGVTGERIRQIANRLILQTGRERQLICSIQHDEDLFASLPFVIACRANGLNVESTFPRICKREFIVEGKSCRIATAFIYSMSGYPRISIKRPAQRADVFAWSIAGGDWLLLPEDKAVFIQTCFTKEYCFEQNPSKPKNTGPYSTQHHYRDYINAWHVFKNEGEDNREHQGSSAGGDNQPSKLQVG